MCVLKYLLISKLNKTYVFTFTPPRHLSTKVVSTHIFHCEGQWFDPCQRCPIQQNPQKFVSQGMKDGQPLTASPSSHLLRGQGKQVR